MLALSIAVGAVIACPALAEPKAETEAASHIEVTPAQIATASTLALEIQVPDPLLRAAFCESNNKQRYADGSLVIGKVTPDIGRFQINPIHNKEAARLGLDLTTWEGNTAYALMLYKRNGLRDWNSSKHCWSSIVTLRAKGYSG